MFKIVIPDKLKEWNKDQIPKYNAIESKEFETQLDAEKYGEAQLGCGVMLYNCKGFRAEIIEKSEINEIKNKKKEKRKINIPNNNN